MPLTKCARRSPPLPLFAHSDDAFSGRAPRFQRPSGQFAFRAVQAGYADAAQTECDRRAALERDARSEMEQKSTECSMLNAQLHEKDLEHEEVLRGYHTYMDGLRAAMAKLQAELGEEQEKHSQDKQMFLNQCAVAREEKEAAFDQIALLQQERNTLLSECALGREATDVALHRIAALQQDLQLERDDLRRIREDNSKLSEQNRDTFDVSDHMRVYLLQPDLSLRPGHVEVRRGLAHDLWPGTVPPPASNFSSPKHHRLPAARHVVRYRPKLIGQTARNHSLSLAQGRARA